MSPVQQGVDDGLSVPLDGVVKTIPGAIILHCRVTASSYQRTRDILVTAKIFYRENREKYFNISDKNYFTAYPY